MKKFWTMKNFNPMLQSVFIGLCKRYSSDPDLIHQLWDELESNYSEKARHYHTLNHLENLFQQLEEVKTEISDWNVALFALFYHDAIYNASKNNNEEASAELATTRMKQFGIPSETVEAVANMILATKTHLLSENHDINLFTDADLSVLGSDWDSYSEYAKNVRKEYRIYPDLIYKPGRRKVLQHFLNMERIFKTEHFYRKFEAQARENLQKELTQ